MNKSDYQEKPSIGVKPITVSDLENKDKRLLALKGAIIRYSEASRSIPIEWILEYNELTSREA